MLITSLLFGISASLDALLVGIGFGLRRVRIRLWQNLAISLVTLLATCLCVGLGHRLAVLLPAMVSAYAGSLVLVLLGLYYIAKWGMSLLRSRARRPAIAGDCGGKPSGLSPACRPTGPEQTPRGAPADCAELLPGAALSLSLPEVLTLSLTLSLNNLAGLALVPAAIATFVCSVLFLEGGNRLGGCRMLQLAGCAAEPVSGILLIGLGMVWLFW